MPKSKRCKYYGCLSTDTGERGYCIRHDPREVVDRIFAQIEEERLLLENCYRRKPAESPRTPAGGGRWDGAGDGQLEDDYREGSLP